MTILSIVGVLIYAAMKLQILFHYVDYKVQTRDLEDHFEEDDRFTSNEGFMVAAGI